MKAYLLGGPRSGDVVEIGGKERVLELPNPAPQPSFSGDFAPPRLEERATSVYYLSEMLIDSDRSQIQNFYTYDSQWSAGSIIAELMNLAYNHEPNH